jgi:hypothetical protein
LVVAVGLIAAILGLAGMGFHQQVDKAASAPSRRSPGSGFPHQQTTPVAARTSSTASRLDSMPHLNDAATRHPFPLDLVQSQGVHVLGEAHSGDGSWRFRPSRTAAITPE